MYVIPKFLVFPIKKASAELIICSVVKIGLGAPRPRRFQP